MKFRAGDIVKVTGDRYPRMYKIAAKQSKGMYGIIQIEPSVSKWVQYRHQLNLTLVRKATKLEHILA